ncbi:MAG TPA: DEAD/DEAH box helicase [Xanthobacteraceae bacterium]|nr:DEAD/DEAH box helicase [Xanthobacteraceae bacterium]
MAGDPAGPACRKTLAGFLAAIDGLVRQGFEARLEDAKYLCLPAQGALKCIQQNLEVPLTGIQASLRARGLPEIEIRTSVRTRDTTSRDRDSMRRKPPHIVVTTPESLYVLLGWESGRAMLASTRTVIVDEIHALASNKRGSHVAVSLERLEALCGGRLQRIGLSATQKPTEEVARSAVAPLGSDCPPPGPSVRSQRVAEGTL